MAANVKFYRGLKAKYSYSVDGGTASGTHVDGLYYATDTHEIFMNGVSYGNVKDLRLQKRTGGTGTQGDPYTWTDATTLYWGGHYRFATSDGNVTAFEFDTPAAKSDGYLAFDNNGTNIDIDSDKIVPGTVTTGDAAKLSTKGYVDDLSTSLAGALLSVAGNARTTKDGDTLSLAKVGDTHIYSGNLTFTKRGDNGTESQTITVKFNAADFVKDSYLTGVTYYQTDPGTDIVPKDLNTHVSTITFPALYFQFDTSGGASNFWVELNDLVDNYTGSGAIDITNHVVSLTVDANGGLEEGNDGLAVKTADTSLTTSSSGLAVKTATKKGLETVTNSANAVDDGLAVKLNTNGGIAFNGTDGGLEIAPRTNGGIEVDNTGVAVKTGAGLQKDANGVSVKLPNNSGLTADSNGLTVNTTGYVTKSDNAIALDTTKIQGYASTETASGDNNLASKKYVDSQLAAGLIWHEG